MIIMHIGMNWQSTGFDWNQVRAFLATVEEGTLSAAARALGLSQPTLGRQVAALEQALGVMLFDRVGRTLVLTPAGLDLLEHVRAMGEAAHRISLAATGQSQTVAGLVRISAGDFFSARILPPILSDLAMRAPSISIEIVSTNTLSDLRRREADIAIRHVRPKEPDLIGKLVSTSHAGFYASPAYIRRHAVPRTVADLSNAVFVGVEPLGRMLEFLTEMGLPLTQSQFRYVTNNTVAICEMVRLGLGIGMISDQMAALIPGIEKVLPELPPIPVETWLTAHRELHTSRRIRIVFDHLAAALAQH